MSDLANPVADQWYRSLTPHQRLFMKESFKDVTGIGWEEIGCCLNMRDRIALFHRKLVAEGVIKPCGYRKQVMASRKQTQTEEWNRGFQLGLNHHETEHPSRYMPDSYNNSQRELFAEG